MRRFFKTLGPAVVGSAGVQLAMFADTIIASFLPTGAVSSLYYADRLYQLPVGVIGIAAGTVLLPEMSRRIAAGDVAGAHAAQNRAIGFTLALAAPFCVAFLSCPNSSCRRCSSAAPSTPRRRRAPARCSPPTRVGLPAVVLIRSAVASFYARADTKTPLIASLAAVAVNVALKIMLMGTYGVVGLALGTAIGTWVNLVLLFVLAYAAPTGRRRAHSLEVSSRRFSRATILLALYSRFAAQHRSRCSRGGFPRWHAEILLARRRRGRTGPSCTASASWQGSGSPA